MIGDIGVLAASLTAIAAAAKVITDIAKPVIAKLVTEEKANSKAKWIVALGCSIMLTGVANVSLFETENEIIHWVGVIGAGAIASLGANYMHEALKVLQTIKSLKK